MNKPDQKPQPKDHAIYRLLIAPDLASLKRVWNSLPNDTRREVESLKNLLKDTLK